MPKHHTLRSHLDILRKLDIILHEERGNERLDLRARIESARTGMLAYTKGHGIGRIGRDEMVAKRFLVVLATKAMEAEAVEVIGVAEVCGIPGEG